MTNVCTCLCFIYRKYPPLIVILSAAAASRSEGGRAVEGPHDAHPTTKRQGISTSSYPFATSRKRLSTSSRRNHPWLLRLHRLSALRRACYAQDDRMFWYLVSFTGVTRHRLSSCPQTNTPQGILTRKRSPNHSPARNLYCPAFSGTTLSLPCRTSGESANSLLALTSASVTG